MGGFASRLLYILSQNKEVKAQLFQNGGLTDEQKAAKALNRAALVEDLASIHKMMGPMTADEEFKVAWQDWWLTSEKKRKAYGSEKLQSLLVRQNLHMLKTSMIFSACESDDRIMRKRHWDKALALVEPAMNNIPTTFRESRAGQIDRGQIKNLPHAIIMAIQKNPEINRDGLKAFLQFGGANMRDIDSMIYSMMTSGKIGMDGSKFKILGDPNHHF